MSLCRLHKQKYDFHLGPVLQKKEEKGRTLGSAYDGHTGGSLGLTLLRPGVETLRDCLILLLVRQMSRKILAEDL